MNIRLLRSAVAVLAAVLAFGGLSATPASASHQTATVYPSHHTFPLYPILPVYPIYPIYPIYPTYHTNTLHAGSTLKAGDKLVSSSGFYSAVMQGDGNFVVYGPHGHGWNTRPSTANRIVMQRDGNLVSYDYMNKATYASRTNPSEEDRLVMQSDGNLVIYSGCTALWSNGVILPHAPRRQCR